MTLTEQQLGNIISEQLNHLLHELNRSLTEFINGNQSSAVQSNGDKYLLAVNSFYYKTFSDRFFTSFRQALQEDITRLLALSHDEASLSRDIMVYIQRYARMYNQVKTIHARLTVTSAESQMKILEITRDHSQHQSDLLYPLKTLLDKIQLFQALLKIIQEFMQDEELLCLARIHPDHIIFLEQVIALDLRQPSISHGLNHLLSHLHHSCNLLRSLSESPWNQAAVGDTVHNMVETTKKVLNHQVPQSLRSFYEGQFKHQYLMYASLMEAGINRNNVKYVRETAGQFEAWMERLVIVLDRGVRFASQHGTELLHSAHYLSSLYRPLIDCLYKDTQDIQQDIEQLVNDLSSSQNADTGYFLDRSSKAVIKSLAKLEPYRDSPALRLPTLALHVERVLLELSFLETHVEMLAHKRLHSGQILDQYLQVYNMIQSYLGLLVNIKVDLERLLAPRNISRFWKNHGVRTERISLEKGCPFPSEYVHLLDRYKVDIRSGDYEYPVVLHEEGDMFIIRVDQNIEFELPPLIIGRRA